MDFLGFVHARLVFGAGDLGAVLREPKGDVDQHVQGFEQCVVAFTEGRVGKKVRFTFSSSLVTLNLITSKGRLNGIDKLTDI